VTTLLNRLEIPEMTEAQDIPDVKFHLYRKPINPYTAVIVLDKANHNIQKMIVTPEMTEAQDIPEMTEAQDIPEMTEAQDIPEMTEAQDIPEMIEVNPQL